MSPHLRWFLTESRTAKNIGSILLAIAIGLGLAAALFRGLGVL